jgi:hypothetical protein
MTQANRMHITPPTNTSAAAKYLDLPPADWFVLDVMRPDENPRGREWAALSTSIQTVSKIAPATFQRCFSSVNAGFKWRASTGAGMPPMMH